MKRLVSAVLALAVTAPVFASSTGLHLVQLKGGGKDFDAAVAAAGGTVTFRHDVGIAFVAGLDEAGAAALGASSGVAAIAADASFELETFVDFEALAAPDAMTASPSDPTTAARYARQWHFPAIDADVAWAAGRLGSPDVTVAILDSGIDYLYPDLAGRVDLARSASFVPADDIYVDLYFPGREYFTDLNFHGTHVAATVASNGLVGAGVTSRTTLTAVKVCDVFGSCPFSSVIAGVLHAADTGADVANMSLGGAFTKPGNGRFVGFINKVFNYAYHKGMTVVVSAGNAATDLDHDGNSYAAYCSAPNVLCVSATGPVAADTVNGPWYDVDALAGYSNFGRSAINVAAPGGNSGGRVWAGCSQTSLLIPVCQSGIFILGLSGTSMAAPHVSGTAALVVEDVGRNPGLVRARIQIGADDLGQPGTDPAYGKGRVNVANSIDLN